MTIYKDNCGEKTKIDNSQFKKTIDALSTKIWKDNGHPFNNDAHEFYGYTPSKFNKMKPSCRNPAIYTQYIFTDYDSEKCHISNSTSHNWTIEFDTMNEKNEFLEMIGIKKNKKRTKKSTKSISYKETWAHPSRLVKNLVPCNAYDFNVWANMAIDMARESHSKIPYYEIGEAICKKIRNMTYSQIARFFMHDERIK